MQIEDEWLYYHFISYLVGEKEVRSLLLSYTGNLLHVWVEQTTNLLNKKNKFYKTKMNF